MPLVGVYWEGVSQPAPTRLGSGALGGSMWPPLSWRGQRAGDEEWPCRGRRLLSGGRTTLSRVFPHGGGVGWGLAHVVGLFFSGT